MRLGRSRQWLIAALIGLPFIWFVFAAGAPKDQGENKANTVFEERIRATPSLVSDGDGANSVDIGPELSSTIDATRNPIDENREVPEIDLMAVTSLQEVLDQLGIDRDYDAYIASHGFLLNQGLQIEQDPYADLSIVELTALAESGDRHAGLFLASSTIFSDPMAALDRLNSLAIGGQLDAMNLAGTYYGLVDEVVEREDSRPISPQQKANLETLAQFGIDPEIEGMAWRLLHDSYAGLPRGYEYGLPTMGGTRSEEDPLPKLEQACDRAVELRRLVEMQAADEGRSMPPFEAAPIGAGSSGGDSLVLSACPGERLPIADFSRCEPIRLNLAGTYSFDAFVCPEP